MRLINWIGRLAHEIGDRSANRHQWLSRRQRRIISYLLPSSANQVSSCSTPSRYVRHLGLRA